jgi:hypothetical protein
MAIKKSDSSGIPFGNNAGRPANPGVGRLYSNGETARLELYTSANAWENIVQEVPGVASISGNYSEQTNSGTIVIYGTNFVSGAIASAIGTNGVEVPASSTTYNSLVQITSVFTGLSNANEPYDIKITNPSNLFGILPDALYINASPIWVTTSGSLGSYTEEISMSVSATATDSDSTIIYSLASGSTLPTGITLNSSNGLISGTLPTISSNTTYSFTINASDGVNTIPRAFSFISKNKINWSTASGTLGTIYDASRTTSSFQLASTGVSSVTYSLTSGSLPTGMTVNSSGLISGSISSAVLTDTTYTFTVTASDGVSYDTPRDFSILLKAPVVTTFMYTGADQDFVLPAGIKKFRVSMWGAGGGGERGTSPGGGGSGGYVSGLVDIENASFVSAYGANKNSFKIVVGRGGNRNTYFAGTNRNPFYGGGGYGKDCYNFVAGAEMADGGGLTGIFANIASSVFTLSGTRDTSNGSYTVTSGVSTSNVVAISGGGGGGSDSHYGGAGGGLVGGSDTSGASTGGTQSAGGSGTSHAQGLFLLGGATYDINNQSTSINSVRGGAGGGGYYGGAGADGNREAGGGGSSYVGYLLESVNTQGYAGSTGGVNPPQNSNSLYPSDSSGFVVGSGGPGNGTAGAGGHGACVITY